MAELSLRERVRQKLNAYQAEAQQPMQQPAQPMPMQQPAQPMPMQQPAQPMPMQQPAQPMDDEKIVVTKQDDASARKARVKAKFIRDRLDREREDVEFGSAVTKSFFRGATFEFGDEIAAAARAFAETMSGSELGGKAPMEQGFIDRFKELMEQSKVKKQAEAEAYPIGTTTAGIAGAVSNIGLPGVASGKIASGINRLIPSMSEKAAKTTGQAVGAMGTAGVIGAGASDAPTIEGRLQEGAEMAPMGLLGLGAAKGIEKAGTKLGDLAGNVARKTLSTATRVSERDIKDYLRRAAHINKLPELGEIATKVVDDVARLKTRFVEGSQQATDLIPDGLSFKSQKIFAPFRKVIRELKKGRTDEHAAAAAELERFISRGEKSGIMAAKEVKNVLKDLGISINAKDQRGLFSPISNRAKLEIYTELNNILKPKAPEYAKAMEKVADDRAALAAIAGGGKKSLFPEENMKLTTRRFERAGIDARDGIDTPEYNALKALDERLGTDYASQAMDVITRKGLKTEKTRGSRNVNLWGIMGMAAGGSPLAAIGSAYGAAVDIYGGKMAKAVLDAYRAGRYAEGSFIGRFYKKYGPTLEKAKTPEGITAIHAELLSKDEDYRALVENVLADGKTFASKAMQGEGDGDTKPKAEESRRVKPEDVIPEQARRENKSTFGGRLGAFIDNLTMAERIGLDPGEKLSPGQPNDDDYAAMDIVPMLAGVTKKVTSLNPEKIKQLLEKKGKKLSGIDEERLRILNKPGMSAARKKKLIDKINEGLAGEGKGNLRSIDTPKTRYYDDTLEELAERLDKLPRQDREFAMIEGEIQRRLKVAKDGGIRIRKSNWREIYRDFTKGLTESEINSFMKADRTGQVITLKDVEDTLKSLSKTSKFDRVRLKAKNALDAISKGKNKAAESFIDKIKNKDMPSDFNSVIWRDKKRSHNIPWLKPPVNGDMAPDVRHGIGDMFNWAQDKHGLTKEYLKRYGDKIKTISTRSDLISHDDYAELIPRDAVVKMHIPAASDWSGKKMEPGAPSLLRRLKAVEKLRKKGKNVEIVFDVPQVNGETVSGAWRGMRDVRVFARDKGIDLKSIRIRRNFIDVTGEKAEAIKKILGNEYFEATKSKTASDMLKDIDSDFKSGKIKNINKNKD